MKYFFSFLFFLMSIGSLGYSLENQTFFSIEEKLGTVEKALKKMQDNEQNSLEAKNQFVFWVSTKNEALQEISEILVGSFLLQNIGKEDANYEAKLQGVHHLLQWVQILQESPSWEALRSMKSELSQFRAMMFLMPYKKKPREEKPSRFLYPRKKPKNYSFKASSSRGAYRG